MAKIDLKKEYKELYTASVDTVSVIDVPALKYISVDGKGAPNGAEAMDAFHALFPVAYRIKFAMKAKGKDFGVMPLEGLWWAEDMNDFTNGRRDRWMWSYMIMQPDFVTQDDFNKVIAELKKSKDIPSLSKVRFQTLTEGKAAQLLHIGEYSKEADNIAKIHAHIQGVGGSFEGHTNKHHEIYLSDMRRAESSKMKTILRQPFHLV